MRRLSQGIQVLHSDLLAMGALVARNISRSVTSLKAGDAYLAHEVLESESQVNRMEIEVDAQVTRLLALTQPVACDLRYLTAALKINTDLERIGDLAATIARRTISLLRASRGLPLTQIAAMAGLAEDMLARSLRAFVERDSALAYQVLAADDAVDMLRDSLSADLLESMKQDASVIESAVDLLFVVRSLERIADHSTNIAEDVLFAVDGVDVRHGSMRVA